jgi:signal transduction histidine kinase
LGKIFNKFYQGDESHSTEGNGIGLALVKQIVHLHEGRVSVTSREDITRFAVTLPKTH